MFNLILFGPPGSGKGTQAKLMEEKFGFLHISTGDLFRSEIGNETPLGLMAMEHMKKGELVPDEITIGMLQNKVNEYPEVSGIIFDGFPRTIAQAESLDKFLSEKDMSISLLISLEVEDGEIERRILKRGETSGRPDDNDVSIIRNRINVYRAETSPVFDFYAEQNKSVSINGIGSIDDIFSAISEEIKTHS
ncbi:MAG TPA: adenylate kinase [Saprospiraceae bacterium]|nr:adenylate kinase [Saprospiraceae bacterium]HPQ20771.1 adenylate kinase [Saprospiraceae bacterium]HRX29864.1 adenylate kinase [Saprospiraceae bacterium]